MSENVFWDFRIGRWWFIFNSHGKHKLETGEPTELITGAKCGRWIRWWMFEIAWDYENWWKGTIYDRDK